jgi:hypothetical protein
MSRKKKNAKKRRLKLLRKSLKQDRQMPDNEKPSFREQLMGAFTGGRTQPSTDGHVQDLQRRLNAGNTTPTTKPASSPIETEYDEWGGWAGFGTPYSPPKNLTGGGRSGFASGHNTGGYSGTTSNYSQSNTPAGIVILLDAEGKRTGFNFKITQGWKDWWRVASRFYVVEKDEMFIPQSRVTLSYGKVSFNACVYQSSEDYIAARWGRKLHYTDRDWLAEHPYATDGGVPSEYTPICVQALLEPYGMGVSRVRLRRGTLAAGPEMQKFMVALGCNPYAMVDHTTTNKEAAEKLGITEQEANQIFRFEFSDDALPGSVCCEKGYAQNGVATGSQGGHARYLAPRDKASNWVVSLQCAPLEQIEYNTPIELPEYIPRKGEAKLELEHVLQPMEDLPVGVKFGGDFFFHEEVEDKKKEEEEKKARPHVKVQATVPDDKKPEREGGQKTVADVLLSTFRRSNANVGGVTTQRPIQLLDGNGQVNKRSRYYLKHKCLKCSKNKYWSSFANGTEICNECMDLAFEPYHCPKCNSSYTGRLVPDFVKKELADGELEATFVCNKGGCGQEIGVKQSQTATHPSLVELISYLPLGTGNAFDREINTFIYHSDLASFDEWWIKTHPDDAVTIPDATGADQQAELLLTPPAALEANVNSLSSETVLLH